MSTRGNKFVLFTSALLVIFFLYNSNFNDKNAQNVVVATINDKKITTSHIKEFALNTYGTHLEEKNREHLEMILNQEVLIYYAHKVGVVEDILTEQFEKQMQYTRERIMLELFLEFEKKENIKVSKREIDRESSEAVDGYKRKQQ